MERLNAGGIIKICQRDTIYLTQDLLSSESLKPTVFFLFLFFCFGFLHVFFSPEIMCNNLEQGLGSKHVTSSIQMIATMLPVLKSKNQNSFFSFPRKPPMLVKSFL